MANNNDNHEGYGEIPLTDYIVIGETFIHKKLFLYWTPTVFLFGVVSTAIGAYTNWWQTLTISLANLIFIRGWYISIPSLLIGAGIFYVWYNRRQKRLLKERSEQSEMDERWKFVKGVKPKK